MEQSAAAAESLRDQAVKLAQVVQVFRLANETPTVSALPAPQPRTTTLALAPKASQSVPVAQAKPVAKVSPAKSVAVKSAPAKPARSAEVTSVPAAKVTASAPEGDWESF